MVLTAGKPYVRLHDPLWSRINRLSEDEVQLCSVVLNMTHRIQQKFPHSHVWPFKAASLASLFVRQCFNCQAALLTAMLKIRLELLLRIHPFWQDSCGVQLIQREWSRGSESLDRTREIEVQKEEGMKDDIPELRLPRTIAPELIRTGNQGVFEHFDSGAKLLPNGFIPTGLHFAPQENTDELRTDADGRPARLVLPRLSS
jgi:hypothetical protein